MQGNAKDLGIFWFIDPKNIFLDTNIIILHAYTCFHEIAENITYPLMGFV